MHCSFSVIVTSDRRSGETLPVFRNAKSDSYQSSPKSKAGERQVSPRSLQPTRSNAAFAPGVLASEAYASLSCDLAFSYRVLSFSACSTYRRLRSRHPSKASTMLGAKDGLSLLHWSDQTENMTTTASAGMEPLDQARQCCGKPRIGSPSTSPLVKLAKHL